MTTSTSRHECQFCADYLLSSRCMFTAAAALIDAANAGIDTDASIAAAAEFPFLGSDRLAVAGRVMDYHPAPAAPSCDCPDPTRCVHYTDAAERDAGAQRAAEEPYRLQVAQEAGEAEAARRAQPGYSDAVAAEKARLLGLMTEDSQ